MGRVLLHSIFDDHTFASRINSKVVTKMTKFRSGIHPFSKFHLTGRCAVQIGSKRNQKEIPPGNEKANSVIHSSNRFP